MWSGINAGHKWLFRVTINYLIDPTFTIKWTDYLFCHLQEMLEEIIWRDSFSRYYVPNVEIKDFNVLIDGRRFFDLPVKNEEETYEKIIVMSRNNEYTTGKLLDFVYLKKKLQINCNWFD